MKKEPHKLPWEIRDPKPEPPVCVDLSDQIPQQILSQASQPWSTQTSAQSPAVL